MSEAAGNPATTTTTTATATAAPDLSGLLGGILQNPELLTRAMETVGTLRQSGMLDQLMPLLKQKTEPNEKFSAPPPEPPTPSLSLPSSSPSESRRYADHKRLLEALRPYLGEERQRRVDQLIRLLGLLCAAEKMGFTGGDFGALREGRHDVQQKI